MMVKSPNSFNRTASVVKEFSRLRYGAGCCLPELSRAQDEARNGYLIRAEVIKVAQGVLHPGLVVSL